MTDVEEVCMCAYTECMLLKIMYPKNRADFDALRVHVLRHNEASFVISFALLVALHV